MKREILRLALALWLLMLPCFAAYGGDINITITDVTEVAKVASHTIGADWAGIVLDGNGSVIWYDRDTKNQTLNSGDTIVLTAITIGESGLQPGRLGNGKSIAGVLSNVSGGNFKFNGGGIAMDIGSDDVGTTNASAASGAVYGFYLAAGGADFTGSITNVGAITLTPGEATVAGSGNAQSAAGYGFAAGEIKAGAVIALGTIAVTSGEASINGIPQMGGDIPGNGNAASGDAYGFLAGKVVGNVALGKIKVASGNASVSGTGSARSGDAYGIHIASGTLTLTNAITVTAGKATGTSIAKNSAYGIYVTGDEVTLTFTKDSEVKAVGDAASTGSSFSLYMEKNDASTATIDVASGKTVTFANAVKQDGRNAVFNKIGEGELTLKGATAHAGKINVDSGVLTNAGTLTNSGVFKIADGAALTNSGTLINTGNIVFSADSSYTHSDSGSVSNNSGGTIIANTGMTGLSDLTSATTLYGGSTFILDNNGSGVEKTLELGGDLTFASSAGSGTIKFIFDGGKNANESLVLTWNGEDAVDMLPVFQTTRLAYAIDNNVTLRAAEDAAPLDFSANISVTVNQGATLTVAAATSLINKGSFANAGKIIFVADSNYEHSGLGSISNNSGGTIIANTGMNGLSDLTGATTLYGGSTFILDNTGAETEKTLNLGSDLKFSSGTGGGTVNFTFDGGGNANDSLVLTWAGEDAVDMLPVSHATRIAYSVDNNVTLRATEGAAPLDFRTNISVTVNPNATLTVAGTSSLVNGGIFTNKGAFTNNGDFSNSGTFALTNDFTNHGVFASTAGSVIAFGMKNSTDLATITGRGAVSLATTSMFVFDDVSFLESAPSNAVCLVDAPAGLSFTGGAATFDAWKAYQGGGTVLSKIDYELDDGNQLLARNGGRTTPQEAAATALVKMSDAGVTVDVQSLIANSTGFVAALQNIAGGNTDGSGNGRTHIPDANMGDSHTRATWGALRKFSGMAAENGFSFAETFGDANTAAAVLTGSGLADSVCVAGVMTMDAIQGIDGRISDNNVARTAFGSDSSLAASVLNANLMNRIWTGFLGQWERADAKDGGNPYHLNSYGMQLGYDRLVGPFTLGGAFGYTRGNFTIKEIAANKTVIDNYAFNLYGTYNHSGGFFASVIAGYARSNFNYSLDAALADKSKYHADTWNAGVRLGYDVRAGRNVTITPSAALLYYHSRTNNINSAYTSVERMTAHNTQLPIDLAFRYTTPMGGNNSLSLGVHGGYAYNFRNNGSEGMLTYNGIVDSGGGLISVGLAGRKPGYHQWNAGAEIKYVMGRFDVGVKYDWYNRNQYNAHRVQAAIGLSF